MEDHTELIRHQRTVKRYNRSGRSGVGTGTISLLMIFTVLCFATLALLSLSTAASDRRIQSRGYENAVQLATAEGLVSEKLAELDKELYALADGGADYEQQATAKAQSLGWTLDEESGYLVYEVEIDTENNLVTTVRIDPSGAGARYTVIGQTTVYQGEWEPEVDGSLWVPGS